MVDSGTETLNSDPDEYEEEHGPDPDGLRQSGLKLNIVPKGRNMGETDWIVKSTISVKLPNMLITAMVVSLLSLGPSPGNKDTNRSLVFTREKSWHCKSLEQKETPQPATSAQNPAPQIL